MSDEELLPGKGTYTAVYAREPDGAWIVYIRGHRHEIHTFARSLRTARENIRDALSLWYDDADSATIVDRVELEPGIEEELAEAEELARLHSDVSRKPETVDQVMLCRVAVPRWGTSSSVRRRRVVTRRASSLSQPERWR